MTAIIERRNDGSRMCSLHRPHAPYDVRALVPVNESAGAGAPANEIEITPEMIEAGYEALASRYFDLVDSLEYRGIARIVFEAMAAKIEKSQRGASVSEKCDTELPSVVVLETNNGRVQVSSRVDDLHIGLLVERDDLRTGTLLNPAGAEELANLLLKRARLCQVVENAAVAP